MRVKDASKAAGANAVNQSRTPEERSRIATKAVMKRHGYPSATHFGKISIGGTDIPCAVLDDGRRVVWQREVVGMLTGNKKGGLSRYLSPANLQPYAPEKFKNTNFDDSAIAFELDGKKAHGFEASDIVEICKMYLSARKANALLFNQIHLAAQAETIVLSLATVGITALIDEATGYQEVRDRKALQAILDAYLRKEYAAWAKRFPDAFYREIFRLKGWNYPTVSNTKPSIIGKYTIDIVYERLEVGLVKELETLNPKTEKGYRKTKHHQWMTDDVGIPALSSHIQSVMGLMRAVDSWEQFILFLDRSFPKKGTQMQLFYEI
jgi:hypothetical protein